MRSYSPVFILLIVLHHQLDVCQSFYDYLWLRSLVNMSRTSFDVQPRCTALLDRVLSSTTNATFRALLSPIENNRCAWLRTVKLDVDTGIGHAAAFLNANINLATQYNLTLYTDFGPTGHGLETDAVDDLFNFGCVFGHSRVPPVDARYIPVTKHTLAALYKRNLHMLDCSKGHTVFDMVWYNNFGDRIRAGIVPSEFCDFFYTSSPLQSIFWTGFTPSQQQRYLPPSVHEDRQQGAVVVGVHLRRGDILDQRRHIDTRFISSDTMLDVLEQLVRALNMRRRTIAPSSHRDVHIYVLTEGAPDEHSVLDYDTTRDRTTRVNVTEAAANFCSSRSRLRCQLRVLLDHEADALQAFATLCASDVLITAPSGFSHLAATLCRPKLVFEVQFMSYSYLLQQPLNRVPMQRSKEQNSGLFKELTTTTRLDWLQ